MVCLLLCLVSTLVFCRTGGVLPHQNFVTHRFHRFPPSAPSSYSLCSLSSTLQRTQKSSYLSRIGKIENLSCSVCGHSSQDTSHLVLHCPARNSLRRSLFGDSLSLHDLWSKPWVVARLLGLHGLPPCPHLSEGVG